MPRILLNLIMIFQEMLLFNLSHFLISIMDSGGKFVEPSSIYQCIFIIHPRDDDVDPLFLVALIQLELSGGRIGAREHKRTRAHSGGGAEDDHLDGIFRSHLMAPHIILSPAPLLPPAARSCCRLTTAHCFKKKYLLQQDTP